MSETRCVGCGHRLSQHRHYAHGGVNRHGSPWVCTVDGCKAWSECRVDGACLACGGLVPGEASSAGDLCSCAPTGAGEETT